MLVNFAEDRQRQDISRVSGREGSQRIDRRRIIVNIDGGKPDGRFQDFYCRAGCKSLASGASFCQGRVVR